MSVRWPSPVRDSSVTNYRGSQAGLAPAFALSISLLSKQMPEECFPVSLGSQAAPRGSAHPFQISLAVLATPPPVTRAGCCPWTGSFPEQQCPTLHPSGA